MAQHTPGPWSRNIPPATKYPIVFAGRNTHIAALRVDRGVTDQEAEANINLIAAAPDLLVALYNLVELCDDVFVKPKECDDLTAARAAIAKAEGHS
jgi:hypothetical protein